MTDNNFVQYLSSLSGSSFRLFSKPKIIITISRQKGSGGRIIATRLSRLLKFPIINSEIIKELSKNNIPKLQVESLLETPSNNKHPITSYFNKLIVDKKKFKYALSKTLLTLTRQKSCIILEQGSNLLLPFNNTLHIRFVAPLAIRAKRVSQMNNVSLKSAIQICQKSDLFRKNFIETIFNEDIDNSVLYDSIINTNNIKSINHNVKLILHLLYHKLGYRKIRKRDILTDKFKHFFNR